MRGSVKSAGSSQKLSLIHIQMCIRDSYEGDKIVGIDVEMAQAVCDKLGYELKVEDMEFNAIMNAVASGKADMGVAGMTVTEDRKENANFTDTYTTAKQVIIVRK